MNTDFKFLKVEVENNICLLTINREDKLNALNSDVIDELRVFLEEAAKEKLSGIILTGAGQKAFIAGADIAQMTEMKSDEAREFAYKGQQVTLMFEESRTPVIAAVNGFALGGGLEMALACDFILCSENAKFSLPEVSLGLIPGFGGTQRLAKIVGRNRAKELLYTGRMIKSSEAKDIGLVLEVLNTKEELIKKAKEIVSMMQKNSPLAIGIAKFVVNRGVDLTTCEGLEFEKNHFGQIFDSEDMKEGTAAFIEKRKANFKGE
ncbi:MAG: enoyl-CoA hydratase-related protein [Bacteriovoracaceae bacterium]|jgi:enoyl-CoA hydratase|nr:enoyl-CoA hydratase-related protein [Bacteriovoracaceae bacterium]